MEKDLRKATVDFDFLEDVEEIITPGNAGAGVLFCCWDK
jgi:hypothetical protein